MIMENENDDGVKLDLLRYKCQLYVMVGLDGIRYEDGIAALTEDNEYDLSVIKLRKWEGWTMMCRNFKNIKAIHEYVKELGIGWHGRVTLTSTKIDSEGDEYPLEEFTGGN